MKADQRRKEIVNILMAEEGPVTGSMLSQKLGASRQIIVQDITVLKAAGYEILSTHSGYIINGSPLTERVFKLHHTSQQTKDELTCIVENGGTVVDVFVWHKVYGKVQAKLNIFSVHGVNQFIEGIKSGKSTELMHITSGYHYHTVRAESVKVLDKIEKELKKRNYIVPEI